MRTDDVELVHRRIVRCDVRLDDFCCFFLQVIEGVSVLIIVGPACNDKTYVLRRIFVDFVEVFVLLEPADRVNLGGIMREGGLSATLVDVEASLFGTQVLGMRVCEFIRAHKFFTDSDGLTDAVRRLSLDGIGFVFPIGEGCFLAGLTVIAFAVADYEYSLFVTTNTLEHIGYVCKSDRINGNGCDRCFSAVWVERGSFSTRCWESRCRELDNSTGPTASELEEVVSPFCAVAELEISVCWMAEELGTVALERGAACSLEELKVAFWFTSGEVELSSPHAVKRDADNSAPVNTKEICECLCIV